MNPEELRCRVEATRELTSSYMESFTLMRDAAKELRSTNNLRSHGRGGSRSPLVKIGLALIAFPDPTVSDLIGGCLVFAGLAYSKMKPPPIYIEDVFAEMSRELKELKRARQIAT